PWRVGEEGRAAKARGDERDAEAERIDEEQENALADGVFPRRHEQDGSEHRTDAGRPAEDEDTPDQIGADEPHGPRIGMVASLAVQNRNVDHPEKVQSGDDDDD